MSEETVKGKYPKGLRRTSKDVMNLTVSHMYQPTEVEYSDGEPNVFQTEITVKGSFVGKDDYANHFKGDLTPEEVRQLPLKLKICFMIQPWDRKFVPRTVEEWANGLGWLAFREKNFLTSERTIKDWRQDAIDTANKYFDFINDNIAIALSSTDFEKLVADFNTVPTEYIKAISKEFTKSNKPIDENSRRNWF